MIKAVGGKYNFTASRIQRRYNCQLTKVPGSERSQRGYRSHMTYKARARFYSARWVPT